MAQHRFKGKVWILIGMLIVPSLTFGGLTVIYDSGDTRPLASYLEVFDVEKTTPPNPVSNKKREPGAAHLERLLPIQSRGLTPGPVARQTVKRPFARPFFLIGSDTLSREWLVTPRDRLAEIGALGMLVEARTVNDLRVTAALANGLPILPASASDIAEALDLSHYPVLITRDGIEQ